MRKEPRPPFSKEKVFQVRSDTLIKDRFRNEIEILENDQAARAIQAHPKCPFYQFAWYGECEIDSVWYYIAANGPIFDYGTQVILLEK